MNNRNWIAVFLGLACLVLFVSVMGASGNWLNNNNNANKGTTPQQINQTVRGTESNINTTPNENVPTKIDANKIGEQITGTNNNNASSSATQNNTVNNNGQNMPKISIPQ